MGRVPLTPSPCRCDDVPGLEIRVPGEGHGTLVLSGELDAFGAAALNAWLSTDVVLDMADVTFIDSRGIRALARAHMQHHVAIRNASPPVRRALKIAGLGELLVE